MDKLKFLRTHKVLRYSIIFVLICTILLLTYLLATEKESTSSKRWMTKHPLLSKRLAVENSNDIIINFVPLRRAINLYFEKANLEHSFFFEYLPTGTTIRSDDNKQLAGASLLKLPTIMSLYKAGEDKLLNLNQIVTIKDAWIDKGFGDLWQQGAGTKISLREAARLALVDSDNTAIKTIRGTLGNLIPSNETVLSELDVDFPYMIDGQSLVSARDYSSVIKCLYLSCYLEPESSQEILGHLAEAPNFNRIAKGIPDNVTVAHKIGVFKSEVQSDCGIVYVPYRPYSLCIIIKAPSEKADYHMQMLSKLVYSFISDNSR